MAEWKKLLIKSAGFGAGLALTLALILWMSLWYSSHPKTWNKSAINAHYLGIVRPMGKYCGPSYRFDIRYSLENTTGTDYSVDSLDALKFARQGSDQSLSFSRDVDFDLPLLVPAKHKVQFTLHVRKADISDDAAVGEMFTQNMMAASDIPFDVQKAAALLEGEEFKSLPTATQQAIVAKLATRIKEKYPAYDDKPDEDVVRRVLNKYAVPPPVTVVGPDGNTYLFPYGTDKSAAIAFFKRKGIGISHAPAHAPEDEVPQEQVEIKKSVPAGAKSEMFDECDKSVNDYLSAMNGFVLLDQRRQYEIQLPVRGVSERK